MSAVIKRVVYGILPSLLSIMTFWLRNPLFSTRLLHMTHSLTHETGHVRLLWYSIHGLNGLTSSADIWIVQKKLRGHIINGWMDGMLVISIEGGATLLAFFFSFFRKKGPHVSSILSSSMPFVCQSVKRGKGFRIAHFFQAQRNTNTLKSDSLSIIIFLLLPTTYMRISLFQQS